MPDKEEGSATDEEPHIVFRQHLAQGNKLVAYYPETQPQEYKQLGYGVRICKAAYGTEDHKAQTGQALEDQGVNKPSSLEREQKQGSKPSADTGEDNS